MDSLCHPWFTTTNLSYRFSIFEISATALCGTTGMRHMSHMNHIKGERFLFQKIRKSGVKKYKGDIQRLAISPGGSVGRERTERAEWERLVQQRLRRGELRAFFQFFSYFMLEKKSYPKQNEICLANAFKKVFHYVPLSFELTAFNVTRMRFKGLHICSFRILSIVLQKTQTIKAKILGAPACNAYLRVLIKTYILDIETRCVSREAGLRGGTVLNQLERLWTNLVGFDMVYGTMLVDFCHNLLNSNSTGTLINCAATSPK